jgi:hypothetical protein
MKMEQSVPKRRHIKFRRRGISQKKTYNIVEFARKLSANLYDIYNCCLYSKEILMMGRGTVRNM